MHEEETVGKQSEVQTVDFLAEMDPLDYSVTLSSLPTRADQ